MQPSFRSLLLEALDAFSRSGYTSEADLQDWLTRLHEALERELPADDYARKELSRALDRVFRRDVERGALIKQIEGVSRYTLDRIAPDLRAELDRRIYAGIDLIRLNRRAAVDKTLQRFSGWITSQPPQRVTRKGGRGIREAAREILKPVAQLKYERRRVAIDQGHKLSSAVAHVVAMGHGAIAGIWHDRGQYDRGYDARPEHLARSGKLFLIRDSWAMEEGLIRKGGLKYTDEIEQPAELTYCSCFYEYVTSPRALPQTLLTARGRERFRSA